jgi:hypothetical protein
MGWDERLRETEPYQGVLFVSREGIASGGDISDASLDGETIRIRWMDGRGTDLSWPALQECTGLARLRSPHLVFVSGSDTIGLLFTSSTPHEGLQLVQPHSLIAAIGWLTEKGFEAA